VEATERELVVEQLAQSRERLVLTVEGLSKEQRSFRPAQDRWSIADCIEHITVVETFVLGKIQQVLQSAPEPEREPEVRGKEQIVLEKVPAREQRVQGPAAFRPQGRWPDFEELMLQFEASRERSVRFSAVTQADVRSHFFPHPMLGLLDCYQWLLLVSAHCERHVRQMEEVKADPGFPTHQQAEQAGA
jgi:uncharacterized damage-inducible protein DinB